LTQWFLFYMFFVIINGTCMLDCVK
jgi:hypothetical protein